MKSTNNKLVKETLKNIWIKLREALISVLPVSLVVVILSFTPFFNFTGNELALFIVATFLLIIGITLFNVGADMSMSSMGNQVGTALMKAKNKIIIPIVLFVLGILITIAEPDLSVLSRQLVNVINDNVLKIAISVGVGVFLVAGVLKIMYRKNLAMMLMFFYLVVFALLAFMIFKGSSNFLAISFDSGGVTTGPITVPFIMALGVGVSAAVGGRGVKENSFGVVALCSIGPIIAVLLLGVTNDTSALNPNDMFDLASYNLAGNTKDFIHGLFTVLLSQLGNVSLALGLIVVFFLIINFIFIKLPLKHLWRLGFGILHTLIGLVIFLTAAEIGFLPVGFRIGTSLAQTPVIAVIFAFILGFLVVLAEPAVHVLTGQVEEVTTGSITRKSMLVALCIGVGLAIGLSIIRIIFDFTVLYYLIPGYLISLALANFVPKIFTAIAFDSGGVASGPLTSSFILPFAIGFCSIVMPDKLLEDAFGIVAMVAMTPLITIQLLGFKAVMTNRAKAKMRMKLISALNNDDIIIKF